MIKQEIVDYIKRQLDNGHDTATIREHLLKHGYTEQTADEGLQVAGAPTAKKANLTKYSIIPFSGKTIAAVFFILIILGGACFVAYKFFFLQKDIAGAATEAEKQINEVFRKEPEEITGVQETIEEEAVTGQRTEEELPEEAEISDETIKEESGEEESEDLSEETEKVSQEEVLQEEIGEIEETTEKTEEGQEIETAAGCTSSSNCESGYACYEKICSVDNDRDWLADIQEQAIGTNTLKQDTDDDGYFDYDEVLYSTNPLDITSPGYIPCKNTKDCPTGDACSASGICITCYYSDKQNYKKKGFTQGVHYTNSKAIKAADSCTTSGKLIEYYCRTDAYLFFEEINCEEEFGVGYSCSNGKCVK